MSKTLEERRKGTEKARAAVMKKWSDPIALQKRFWAKVRIGNLDECWPWTACKHKQGYGRFRRPGRTTNAHRTAYELTYGAFDSHLECCHTCDNPPCCNPSHLFIGTFSDNINDAIQKGRRTYKNGEQNAASKLTEQQVCKILELSKDPNLTRADIARQFNVSWTTIDRLWTGKTWSHLKLNFQSSGTTISPTQKEKS